MKRFVAGLLLFTVLAYSNSGFFAIVKAEDQATPSATVEIFVPTLTPEIIPTATPEPIIEATPSVIPTQFITSTPTPVPTAMPIITSEVKTDREYLFDNGNLKINFKKIDNPGTLEIEKKDYNGKPAYDITSTMANGSFVYDLYFLKTDSSKKQIKYSENDGEFKKLESVEEDGYVVARNLNHFTLFVLTDPDPVNEDCSNTILIGDKCFNTIQAAVSAASPSAVVSIKNGTYLESVILDKSNISLVGESKNGVIIKNPVPGSNTTGLTIRANGVSVKNLTIREFADGISLDDIDGFVLDGVLIVDNSYAVPSGIHIVDSTNVTITNNEFSYNSIAIDLSESTPGTVTGFVLTNNVFSNNDVNLVNSVQENISDATSNNWGSSNIDVIESSIVHGCSANRYLHGICNDEDLTSDFGSVKYANISTPSFTSPACDSLTNQSTITPTWNNISGANVSYVVERTNPSGTITYDSSPFDMNLDGIWRLRIKAQAGAQDSGYSNYCDVTYDSVAPTDPGTPDTLSPTRALIQSWFWAASTDSLSGLKNYLWFVTGGSLGTTTNNYLTTFLGQGTWNLSVVAQDNAGNQSASISGALVVDRSLPSVSANNSSSSWYKTNPDITLSVTDVGDALIYVAKYKWDSVATSTNGTDFSNGQVISIPNDGEHTLYLYAMDNAGNSSTWSGTYKLDTQNPVLSLGNSSSLWTNSVSSILVGATDAIPGSGLFFVKYAWNQLANNGTLTANGANLLSTLVEGNQVLRLYAEDEAGRFASNSGQYRFDVTRPTSAATSPTYANSGTIPVSFNSSDNLSGVSNVKLWFRFNNREWKNNGETFDFDPNNTDGSYEFYTVATDSAGNQELSPESADTTTIFDHTAPTANWVTPLANSTVSGIVSLSANVNDNLSGVDSTVYKFAADGSSDFTTIPTSNWDTRSLPLGRYVLRVSATDKAGNTTNVDENVYVAAVITSFKHFTVDTNRIQIDWTTDRPTDGRIVYDRLSHIPVDISVLPNYGYAFGSGTEHPFPNYGTSHSIVLSGLSSGTYYYFRAISSGTPVVVSFEQSDRTFSDAVLGGVSDGRGNAVINTPPANPPTPAFVQDEVAGAETEVFEVTPTPTPIPEVEGTSTDTFETSPGFNWWFVITPASFFLFLFLLWLARRTSN